MNQFVRRLNEIQYEMDGYLRYGTKTNEFENEQYTEEAANAISNPVFYWQTEAEDLFWHKKFAIAHDYSQNRWWSQGLFNLCYNCVDRHCESGHGEDIGLAYVADQEAENSAYNYTFSKMQKLIGHLASIFVKKFQVAKGDRVVIFMP